MSVILETKQLCKFYGAGENQVKAVNQVDIQIERFDLILTRAIKFTKLLGF